MQREGDTLKKKIKKVTCTTLWMDVGQVRLHLSRLKIPWTKKEDVGIRTDEEVLAREKIKQNRFYHMKNLEWELFAKFFTFHVFSVNILSPLLTELQRSSRGISNRMKFTLD